jgi:hypothetical protein
MSSTRSPADVDRELRRFWAERMVPAAGELRRRGVRFFETGPRPHAGTYFIPHAPAASPFTEIEPERPAELLREMWSAEGLPELAALAGPLAALGPVLKPGEEESAEISPFVYVMF